MGTRIAVPSLSCAVVLIVAGLFGLSCAHTCTLEGCRTDATVSAPGIPNGGELTLCQNQFCSKSRAAGATSDAGVCVSSALVGDLEATMDACPDETRFSLPNGAAAGDVVSVEIDAGGATVFQRARSVTVSESEPNGPGCGTCRRASVDLR